MNYIDIHCHLDFPDYEGDREEVIARMRENKVGAITIGTDLESSKRAVEIADKNVDIWACVGTHPMSKVTFDTDEFHKLTQHPKVVAIGECGLDYFRIKDESEKEVQKKLFVEQIEFAIEHDKPLMLHCRESYDDVLEILGKYKEARGNAHFFAGTVGQAKAFLDLGFTMSFTGVITFTRDYDEVIKFIPPESIMSETDSPFIAPITYRGKRNEPVYVIEVANRIAEIKGVDESEMAKILLDNARRVFSVD